MKKLILPLLILLLPSFVCAKEYIGLKTLDFKNLDIIFESIKFSNTGLKKDDIIREIKLICLRNGINIVEGKGNFLYINVIVLAGSDKKTDIYDINISYTKYTDDIDLIIETGKFYVPHQGTYGGLGLTNRKQDIIDAVNASFKNFLIDYLESNKKRNNLKQK
jgi:hypothetical protein